MSTTTIRMPADLKARVTAAAEERYARIVATGKTIPWQEMRSYLKDRLAGKAARRPAARKLAR
ncbi:MAG: CopG family transcriptional regulator [Rhodocyclaceae bacterium]|nr:CopG family transcriptional regulator [Rhodocyclaceae bacterium]